MWFAKNLKIYFRDSIKSIQLIFKVQELFFSRRQTIDKKNHEKIWLESVWKYDLQKNLKIYVPFCFSWLSVLWQQIIILLRNRY